MSVVLELTELEADYVTQALEHELNTIELYLRHPGVFPSEVLDGMAFKVTMLSSIIERLVSE